MNKGGFAAGMLLTGLLLFLSAIPAGAGSDDLIIQGGAQVNDIIQPGLSAFDSIYPGYNIEISVPDTSPEQAALNELKAGNIDIAMAGWALASSDDPTGVLKDLMIGRQAIVMIVNAESGFDNISYSQIKAIYEGTQSDWSQLGGSPLTPRAMLNTSGLYQNFTSTGWFAGVSGDLEETVIDNTGLPRLEDNIEMALAIADNPDQIGYIGFGYIPYLDNTVKCLNVKTSTSGSSYISPIWQNMYSLAYPSRDLHLWFQKANHKTALTDYLKFIASPVGQDEIALAGGVKKYPDADLNKDGEINLGDVVMIGLQWGKSGDTGWIFEDINRDGMINILDVVKIGLWWDYSYTPVN
jgi:ABC-type phosphate transport system substrate-binding protein